MLIKYPNAPAHLQLDNTPYFITASIYKKRHLLRSDKIKEYLLKTIQQSFAEKGWILNAWVILDNHYHLMVISNKGKDLAKIIGKIHALSAQLHKELNAEKPIWWNYWDYCPCDEKDYFIRLNYLFNNPIKHGYVTNLNDYRYSSFHDFLKTQGRDNVITQFKNYTDYKRLSLDEDME